MGVGGDGSAQFGVESSHSTGRARFKVDDAIYSIIPPSTHHVVCMIVSVI